MEYFFYLVGLLPYAVAAVLGLALPLVLLATYNYFLAGLILVAATLVLEAMNLLQPILRIGITLYVPDLPMVMLGVAAGLRWMLRKDVPRRHMAWVLLALVFFVDLAIGLARHGTTAGVQGRGDFYAIAAATYGMSFPIGQRQVRQLVQVCSVAALALVLVCVYRWIVYYAPIPDLLPPGGVYSRDGAIRVIGANLALLIADMAVVGLFFLRGERATGLARWLSPVLLATVLVLQHRSVWLAGIAGVLLCLLLARAERVPLWQQVAVTILVAATAAAPIFLSDTISQQVQSSATRAIAGEGTVDARFSNWRSTIEQWLGDGARAIVVGRELGSDTTRLIESESGTVRINFNSHNHYIDVLTNLGLLGFFGTSVILLYAAGGLIRQCRKRDEDSPYSALLLVVLGMQLTFFVAYTVDYLQYLILGVTVAWVAGHAAAERKPAVKPARAGAQGLSRSSSVQA
jgi:hypothetical protein